MYTIRTVSEPNIGAKLEQCLHCKKNVATAPSLGTLEVKDSGGSLVGYLHPFCSDDWQAQQAIVAAKRRAENPVEPTQHDAQPIQPRREREWWYVVVVEHATRGTVRIPTDVLDEMNAITQAQRRNPEPGYLWDGARVERLPISEVPE